MNSKVIFLILGLLSGFQITAGQIVAGKPYATGNYIFCGKDLPKNFSWLIERQDNTGKWTSIAEIQAPKNEAECRTRLMSLPKAVSAVTEINQGITNFIWNNIKGPSATLDSLYLHATDPRYQFIAGAGWFDDAIKIPGTYKYRISRFNPVRGKISAGETSVKFPPEPYLAEAYALRYKVNMGIVEISYELSDLKNTVGLKVQRSPYMQNLFREISTETMFVPEKGKTVALVKDKDVTSGLTYSYIVIPYDALGNFGKPSEPVNVYFVTKPADIGLITEFAVVPQPDKGGNQLKWNYNHSGFINAIEIYRSASYNDNYRRVASLPAGQMEYFDGTDLEPSITYFYYVVLNNGYGTSLPSARAPAILQGKKENILPPQNLSLNRNGNVVTLNFLRLGYDVRGYYVYRASGYASELKQLPRMLHSTDSLLTYTDTLPVSSRSSVYSYAVASVNTSYNISPMSNRVSTSYSGGQMPVPDRINALLGNDEVRIVWNDVSGLNSAITAYEVYRKTMDGETEVSAESLLGTVNFMENSFIDKLIKPGKNYVYRVRCIGSDSTDVGSFSLPYSLHVPADKALPPGEVSAIASAKAISLKWTLPAANGIQAVLVYRAPENGKENLLKTLGAEAESYSDDSARKGVMYYYFIVIKYKNGSESRPTDAVSAKI